VADDLKGDVLLFHVPGPDLGQPRFHLTYIDPRTVEGITVLDADTVAHWISFGAIPAPEPKTPPSRFELNRQLGEAAKSASAPTCQKDSKVVSAKTICRLLSARSFDQRPNSIFDPPEQLRNMRRMNRLLPSITGACPAP
jgi:hypothetical protein